MIPPGRVRTGTIRLHGLGRVVATLVCVAGVPLVVIALVRWLFGVPVSSFRPVMNDEVAYWHQALTFTRVGFRGGYYTLGELTNPSGFTPFGPHGPGFAITYGLFGALLGWHRHSVVVLNLVAIAAAAWAWVTLSGVSTARIVMSALLLATFWPLVFWAPTGMQEGLHSAGAVMMAAFFAHALGPVIRRWAIAAGWLVLVALSFIRPSWVVLIPLWSFVTIGPRDLRQRLATLAGSALLALAIVFAYSRSTAPFPTGFFFLKVFDLNSSVTAIAVNLVANVRYTIATSEYAPLEVLHRSQYWGLLGLAVVMAAVAARRARPQPVTSSGVAHLTVGALAMAGALLLMLALYTLTNWAEHRVLSPFLLFAALLAIASAPRMALVVPAALIVSNIAAITVFIRSFDASRHDNFVWDRRGVYALSEAIEGKIAYHPGEPRWCNTLLTSQYPPYLIAIPAGVGLSVVREPDLLALPPKSRYLLLDSPSRDALKRPIRMEELATLPYGTLYRNLESACPPSP